MILFYNNSQVTNTGKEERFCEECVAIPENSKIHPTCISQDMESFKDASPSRAKAYQHDQKYSNSRAIIYHEDSYDPNSCAGCKIQLKEGQALIALDRQWHISCFRYPEHIYPAKYQFVYLSNYNCYSQF